MRVKLLKGILTAFSLICVLCITVMPIYAEPQGTGWDGNAGHRASETGDSAWCRLGWSRVSAKNGFWDVSRNLAVGEDGVLRMELGGSKSYVLTCMNSSVAAPEVTQAPATTEETQNESNEGQKSNGSNSGQDTKGTVAGIPYFISYYLRAGWVWLSAV